MALLLSATSSPRFVADDSIYQILSTCQYGNLKKIYFTDSKRIENKAYTRFHVKSLTSLYYYTLYLQSIVYLYIH
nr:MAG TPA: hypothetical protein [Caudoviricetes sp.]